MKMSDLSPRAEPVTWAMILAAALSALTSYGFNLTDELKDFILMAGPFVLIGFASRFAVFAPDTVKKIRDAAYQAGLPPTEPKPELPSPPGGGDLPTPAAPDVVDPAFNPQDEDTWPSDPTKHSL